MALSINTACNPGTGTTNQSSEQAAGPVEKVMNMPALLFVVFSMMDPEDVAYFMMRKAHCKRPDRTGSTFHGGIRTVSKSVRVAFDNYAPKTINMDTYRAYNLRSARLIGNITNLFFAASTDEHVMRRHYTAFLNTISSKQILGLKSLTIDSFSSHRLVMDSDLFTKVLPDMDLQLDVFASGFTCGSKGHFWSLQDVQSLAFNTAPAAETRTGERTMGALIRRCRALDLSCCFSPYQVFCAMKLASGASTLRISHMVGGSAFVQQYEQDAIVSDFLEGNSKKEPKVFANFKRLEIEYKNIQFLTNIDLLEALSGKGLLLDNLQVLPNVTDVSIKGGLWRDITQGLCLPNVRRVECTGIPALTDEMELSSEAPKSVPVSALSADTAHDLCLLLYTSFPNACFMRVCLRESVDLMRSIAGKALTFLRVLLGRFLDMAESKQGGLVLELCPGVVTLAGLDLSEENNRCFYLGVHWSSKGRVKVQLVPGGPCCSQGKVVCRCRMPGSNARCPGKFLDLNLRCGDCSRKERSPDEIWVDAKPL